jgi:hypothetical protein
VFRRQRFQARPVRLFKRRPPLSLLPPPSQRLHGPGLMGAQGASHGASANAPSATEAATKGPVGSGFCASDPGSSIAAYLFKRAAPRTRRHPRASVTDSRHHRKRVGTRVRNRLRRCRVCARAAQKIINGVGTGCKRHPKWPTATMLLQLGMPQWRGMIGHQAGQMPMKLKMQANQGDTEGSNGFAISFISWILTSTNSQRTVNA